mmetsp:Transcript_5193/g.9136  ORF Transcript_5193/g.9136 Transcript_5193/m.9136 type:complete len:92 (+) Transcript_5193:2873-3148(+)
MREILPACNLLRHNIAQALRCCEISDGMGYNICCASNSPPSQMLPVCNYQVVTRQLVGPQHCPGEGSYGTGYLFCEQHNTSWDSIRDSWAL